MTTVYPHLYRYDFVTALALGGPADKHQRRLLMVLTAMADHWSVVMPDRRLMADLFNVSMSTCSDLFYQFHEDQYLSELPDTDLCLLHLPQDSQAYRRLEPKFEWHTRGHAPLGGFSRVITTHVKSEPSDGPIPLTARALQLAVDSVGKTKEGRFAYIAFVQQSLMDQPENTEWHS